MFRVLIVVQLFSGIWAASLAFSEKLKGHKPFVLIVTVVLLLLSTSATLEQNQEREKAERAEKQAQAKQAEAAARDEAKILSGVQETQRVTALNTELQQHLIATNTRILGITAETLNQEIGGSSYPVVTPEFSLTPDGFPLMLFGVGKDSLIDVRSEIRDGEIPDPSAVELHQQLDRLRSGLSSGRTSSLGNVKAGDFTYLTHHIRPEKSAVSKYRVRTSSQNGTYFERLEVEFDKGDDRWKFRYEVTKDRWPASSRPTVIKTMSAWN